MSVALRSVRLVCHGGSHKTSVAEGGVRANGISGCGHVSSSGLSWVLLLRGSVSSVASLHLALVRARGGKVRMGRAGS